MAGRQAELHSGRHDDERLPAGPSKNQMLTHLGSLWPIARDIQGPSEARLPSLSVAIDVQRCRAELDELEAELRQWQAPDPPGLSVWRHKLYALIGEILDPKHALAIRLSGVRLDTTASSLVRRWGGEPVVRPARNPWADEDFNKAKQDATEIIEALRWDLGRYVPATDPFTDATVDPELWEHVRGLIEAKDWEKVAREAAVFVEGKLRNWASVPPSVTGSVNVLRQQSGQAALLCPRPGRRANSRVGSSWPLASPWPCGIRAGIRSGTEVTPSGTHLAYWAWPASC